MLKTKRFNITTIDDAAWVLNKLLARSGLKFEAETNDISDRFYESRTTYRLLAKSTDDVVEEESF
jgi:hypothetical protein